MVKNKVKKISMLKHFARVLNFAKTVSIKYVKNIQNLMWQLNYVIKSVIVLASFLQLTKAFWLSIISSFVLAMISNVCRY